MQLTIFPTRNLSWRRRVAEYCLVLPLIYLVWLAALYTMQGRFMFPRSLAGHGAPAGHLPRGVESIWIDAGAPESMTRVEAWFLPPLPSPAGKSPAIIYFHGNAELIDDRADDMRPYREMGYAVLLPEFRGYGRSGGSPSQDAIVADAVRFYDLLAARPDIDPTRIVVHGRSLGAAVAAQLAAKRPVRAMILESAFTSVAPFAWRMGAPPLLLTSPFRTDRIVEHFDRPLLILHGADDDIIPASHGRRLHALDPASTYAELAGHHNDFPANRAAYWRAINAFLAAAGLPHAAG